MKKSTLKQYAKLIARVGANVQKNQSVVISASVNDEYFVKYVVEECYKAKAKHVRIDWYSDEITKLTYKNVKTEVLKKVPNYMVEKWKYDVETLPARIYIDSSDPDALASVDQNKMMEVRKATGPIFHDTDHGKQQQADQCKNDNQGNDGRDQNAETPPVIIMRREKPKGVQMEIAAAAGTAATAAVKTAATAKTAVASSA